MNTLRIFLLGRPLISWGDQPVRVQRRLERTMLYYLALHPEGIHRDELMVTFWPENPDGRKRLREALSRLRKELPEDDLILADRELVRLAPGRIYVDALEFFELDRQSRRNAQVTPLPEATYQQMNKAADLWRSPRFLGGTNLASETELEDWFRDYGQAIDTAHIHMLERLGQHHVVNGDLELALRRLRTALEIDDLYPEAHYNYLSCLMRLERRSEALAHCERIEQEYRQNQLEIPQTLADLCASIRKKASTDIGEYHPIWPTWLTTHVPFVGRKDELDRLRRSFQRGGVAVIYGESGAGKTRLVYQLYHDIEPVPRLLLAPSRSMETNLPFQPLIELVRHSILPDELEKLNRVWAVQIYRLMPELTALRQDIKVLPETSLEEAQTLIFEAIHQLLSIISAEKRVLLFLDDAQWCDEETLAALAYLVKRGFFRQHGLLVLAARQEEKNLALENLLASVPPQHRLEQIELEQLNLAEVKEFIYHVIGQNPSDEVAQHLADDTGSNPLFLLETLRALIEYFPDIDLQRNPEHFPLARNFHQTVRERLRHLPQHTRQVLTIAAFADRSFGTELLEAASQLTPEQIVQALEELEQAHLIRPIQDPANGHAYIFIHDKIREIVMLELSQARRRLFHLRLARALEKLTDAQLETTTAFIAQHYKEGGDYAAAFRNWLNTGQYAYRRFSLEQAYSAYRQAEIILQKYGTVIPDEDVYQLYSSWGEAAEDCSDAASLGALAASLMPIAEQRRNQLLAGTALGYAGCVFFIENKLEQAHEKLEQALVYLNPTGNLSELMAVHTRLGLTLAQENRILEAMQMFERIASFSQNSDDPRVLRWLVNAYYAHAMLVVMAGEPKRGLELVGQALLISQRIFYTYGTLRLLTIQAIALTFMGKYAESLQVAQQALQIAETAQHKRLSGQLMQIMGYDYLLLGKLDEAWQYLHVARQDGSRFGEIDGGTNYLIGNIYRYLMAYSQAIQIYSQGVMQDPPNAGTLGNLYLFGLTQVISGNRVEGEIILNQAIETAKSAHLLATALFAQAEKMMLLGPVMPVNEFEEQFRQFKENIANRSIVILDSMAELIHAQADVLQNHPEAAISHIQSVLSGARDVGNPWLELQGYQMLISIVGTGSTLTQSARQRVEEILEFMRQHSQHPELQPLFEAFRQKTLSNFD